MTQPFADALTWVPRSRALGTTLGRAYDLARAQSHSAVTLEHLLLALIEDPDASSLLLTCNVDLLGLNAKTASHLEQQPKGGEDLPTAAPQLKTILEYAVAAARQSKRTEINGAIVVAAIVGEGKSDAARMLMAGGLNFLDAVQALRRSSVARPSTPENPAPTPEPPKESQVAATSADPGVVVTSPSEAPAPPPLPSPPPAATQTSGPQRSGTSSETAKDPSPAPPSNGFHPYDDDPVTTARRRIDAIRKGTPLAQLPPPQARSDAGATTVEVHGANGLAAARDGVSEWAPPPLPHNGVAARPARLPPPVPPIPEAPPRAKVAPASQPSTTRVPWGGADAAELPTGESYSTEPLGGAPIETSDLIDMIPARMTAGLPATVEVRVRRADVLATTAATSGRDAVLTRAVAVKLRAPEGGFHIENAAPETQWFDTRSSARAIDEVRWRWLVTPRGHGRKPLNLSIVIRSVAADGMTVETTLPEQQVTVGVAHNQVAEIKAWGKHAAAALVGVGLTLLFSGGIARLLF